MRLTCFFYECRPSYIHTYILYSLVCRSLAALFCQSSDSVSMYVNVHTSKPTFHKVKTSKRWRKRRRWKERKNNKNFSLLRLDFKRKIHSIFEICTRHWIKFLNIMHSYTYANIYLPIILANKKISIPSTVKRLFLHQPSHFNSKNPNISHINWSKYSICLKVNVPYLFGIQASQNVSQ